jgi:hypothetical protein
LQKPFCRRVEVRSPELVTTALDANQITFHQLSQDFAAADASYGLDFGSRRGLAIGHNGECFQGGCAESNLARHTVETAQPDSILGSGEQLKATGHFFDSKRPSALVVVFVQLAD